MHTFDPAELETQQVQNYLQHLVAPRPIALVSTIDRQGRVNLSPFSFFNLFSANPPICIFSPARRVRDNTVKHTYENVQEIKECVINMVDEHIVYQASQSSKEYPKDVNEFLEAGLTQLPSQRVSPPRVAEAPAQLECLVKQVIPLGENPGSGNLVIAEVVLIHLADHVLDKTGNIRAEHLQLVARLGGEWYCSVNETNMFRLPKP